MDDVRVHRNSDKPVQLDAAAYTQGNHIHVGPGQEKHLAHEAWHVVQQKQGRVRATMQMKGKGINNSEGLEREADVMGKRAGGAWRTRVEHSAHRSNAGGARSGSNVGESGVSRNAAPIQMRSKAWRRRRREQITERAQQRQALRERLLPPQAQGQRRIRPSDLGMQKQRLRKVQSVVPHSDYQNVRVQRQNQPAHQFADFLSETRGALHALDSGARGYENLAHKHADVPKGQQLLKGLNESANTVPGEGLFSPTRVRIQDSRLTNDQGNRASANKFFKARESLLQSAEAGPGSGSVVHFNPDIRTSDGRQRPAFVGLGHELVHALRSQRGEAVNAESASGLFRKMGSTTDEQSEERLGRNQEELETVGLAPSPTGISENDIREEHGVEPRPSYSGVTYESHRKDLIEELKKGKTN